MLPLGYTWAQKSKKKRKKDRKGNNENVRGQFDVCLGFEVEERLVKQILNRHHYELSLNHIH